jgi:hypothetical protein
MSKSLGFSLKQAIRLLMRLEDNIKMDCEMISWLKVKICDSNARNILLSTELRSIAEK